MCLRKEMNWEKRQYEKNPKLYCDLTMIYSKLQRLWMEDLLTTKEYTNLKYQMNFLNNTSAKKWLSELASV